MAGPARKGDGGRVVVVGFGVTGMAVSAYLVREGWTVIVVEDDVTGAVREEAGRLGVTLGTVDDVSTADLVVPSPGVVPHHPVHAVASAAGVPVLSELELAWRAARGRPMVAITGTNGKTTVTTMVAAMLAESGRKAVAAGNIGLPLIDTVSLDVDVVVAEVSSFQLQHTRDFRPSVAVWLNFAPDHLDWHPSIEHYAAAKARVWANQREGDVAVVNAEDGVVAAAAASAQGRVVTFGRSEGDFHLAGDSLRGPAPERTEILALHEMSRSLPHDVLNALAAAAAATAAGADVASCRAVLAGFRGLPHRLQLVGEAGGVGYYDDSKSTTPASVLAALRGFDWVVLIAGGRNKGLDFAVLRDESHRIRSLVAIGEAAPELVAALGDLVPVTVANSMHEAVMVASRAARDGDAVVLSPGCASFDWYRSYAERGDDFTAAVKSVLQGRA